jgi:FMN-dependent NADH-azoreductase
MAKVYYLQASPRKERSRSNHVAAVFLEGYIKANPDDVVETMNIFEADLPSFDGLTMKAKYTILHGKEHTAEERRAWDAVEKIIDRFKAADKYVISLPMWNFGIPYRLKHYIDILVQPGYTFTVGDNGYEGLVKGKPVVCIYARGGAYLEAVEYDKQKPYMEQILGFMGFEDIQSIVVEPTLAGGEEQAKKAVEDAIRKAKELAPEF